MFTSKSLVLRSSLTQQHSISFKGRVPVLRYCSTVQAAKTPPDEKPKIVIPKRIPRGPTTILEALADTVGHDPTAHAPWLLDDYSLLPGFKDHVKRFGLAAQSGELTAKEFIQEWPNLFVEDAAEPKIKDFTPLQMLMGETAQSEEGLLQRIALKQTENAGEIYDTLQEKGVSISDETKLAYLDLMCRTCCSDKEQYIEAGKSALPYTPPTGWRLKKGIMQLFESLCDTYPQAYISMICGMCQYGSPVEALDLYNSAREKNIIFPVEVHNNVLCNLVAKYTSYNELTNAIEKILVHMEENGIRPDLHTFNNILSSVTKLPSFTPRVDYAMQVVKEMRECNIEPSLRTYYYLLRIVYLGQMASSDFLIYVVDEVTSIPHRAITHSEDTMFFNHAMRICEDSLNAVEPANKLYKYVWSGRNKGIMSRFEKNWHFHDEYLRLVTRTEPIEKTMALYEDMKTQLHFPGYQAFTSLLQAIELYEKYEYVYPLYEDILLNGLTQRVDSLTNLAKLMTADKVRPEIQEQFRMLADDSMEKMMLFVEQGRNKIFSIPAELLSYYIIMALNMSDTNYAFSWFEKYHTHAHHSQVLQNSDALTRLANVLKSKRMYPEFIRVLDAMMDLQLHEDVHKITSNMKSIPKEYSAQLHDLIKATTKRPTDPEGRSPTPEEQPQIHRGYNNSHRGYNNSHRDQHQKYRRE